MDDHIRYTIGEVAKLSGVTVRTLQYYDRIGLLPIEKDESGRRYYTSRDLAKLQQVLFYRSLGLPLKKIGELVVEAASPRQIAEVLKEQREFFLLKLNEIQSYISLIDAVLAGAESGGAFHSQELIRLIAGLNRTAVLEYEKLEYKPETKELFLERYGVKGSALTVYWQWKSLVLECVSLVSGGVDPCSETGQEFAQKWLDFIERITQGSRRLLEAHRESYEHRSEWPEEDQELMVLADPFIDQAVAYYLETLEEQEVPGEDD